MEFDKKVLKELSEKDKQKLDKDQQEYKKLISPNNFYDRLKQGKKVYNAKEREELYKYNVDISKQINKYIDGKSNAIDLISKFINNVLDKDKNKRINVKAFNKGYKAICGICQITTEEMHELLNGDLPEELQIDVPDCDGTPMCCNYRYYLKTFFGILNKNNKIAVLNVMFEKIKENKHNKSVKEFIEKSRIKAMAVKDIRFNVAFDNMLDDVEGHKEMIISIYKSLMDKESLNILKDKYGRDIVNKIKNKIYNKLHYLINQDILRLEHFITTLIAWHKSKSKVKKKVKSKKKTKGNSRGRRSYMLNKEMSLLRQTHYNLKPETKEKKRKYFVNYHKNRKADDIEKKRRKDALRTSIYTIMNRDKVKEIRQRYLDKKKLKKSEKRA